MPVTSDEWGRYYVDDLVIEYLEDLFERDEHLARQVRMKHLGVEVGVFGDPLLDMWERQVAQGLDPDLDACEDKKSQEVDAQIREDARRHYEKTGELIYNPLSKMNLLEYKGGGDFVLGQGERVGSGQEVDLFNVGDYMGGRDLSSLVDDLSVDDISEIAKNVPPEMFDQLMAMAQSLKK